MNVYHFPAPFEGEHLLSCLMRYSTSRGRKEYVRVAKQVSTNVSKIECSCYWRTVHSDVLNQYLPKYRHQIAVNNTLLSVYSRFTHSDFYTLLIEQLALPHKLQLKYEKIEQLHSGWKWCPDCAVEDEEKYGVSYWRCEHQLSFKRRCSKHRTVLLSRCQCCDYAWCSLLQGPGPLTKCPNCGKHFSPCDRDDSDLDLWIEESANSILQTGFEFKKVELQEHFKAQYGFEEFKRQWTVAERKHITYQQDLFGKWLDTLDLSKHLVPLSNNKPYSQHPAFNVSAFTFKNHSLAPMINILFMRYCQEQLC